MANAVNKSFLLVESVMEDLAESRTFSPQEYTQIEAALLSNPALLDLVRNHIEAKSVSGVLVLASLGMQQPRGHAHAVQRIAAILSNPNLLKMVEGRYDLEMM